MQFTITYGRQIKATYFEAGRFTVTVSKANPSIADILAEARRHTLPSELERLKPYCYLIHMGTLRKLDESQTVADYRLPEEAVLRLTCMARP